MQKRGQVTLFIILGVVLIVIFGLVYYISGYKTTKTAKTQAQVAGNSDVKDIVKSYAENCIKKISEEALFNKIGVQGGYISVSEISPTLTIFDGYAVPVYLEVNCHIRSDTHPETRYNTCIDSDGNQFDCDPYEITVCDRDNCICEVIRYIPSKDSIKNRIFSHIKNEFERCFQTNIFDGIGIKVAKQSATIQDPDVSINEEDVSIKLNYPITIKRGDAVVNLESFMVILPIRLKKLHEGADDFVRQVNNVIEPIKGTSGPCGTVVCTSTYNIPPDCQSGVKYNKNGLTNVYVKSGDTSTKVIQFFDFSTYLQKYFKSFVFQFAVRLNGVNIEGACAG